MQEQMTAKMIREHCETYNLPYPFELRLLKTGNTDTGTEKGGLNNAGKEMDGGQSWTRCCYGKRQKTLSKEMPPNQQERRIMATNGERAESADSGDKRRRR